MTADRSLDLRALLVITALAFAALVAWDASFLDLRLARVMGAADGFHLRDNWVLSVLLHDGVRKAAWALAMGLCLVVWWPVGPFRRLGFDRRIQLAVTTLIAAFAVAGLKSLSKTSCPWDLNDFGGVARYASHWSGLADGGSGRCFPAGHASSGFAFIGGYFAFRTSSPSLARTWLFAAIAAGLLFGLVQQLRGAHFASHTLWTGFICWTIALGIDALHGRALEQQVVA